MELSPTKALSAIAGSVLLSGIALSSAQAAIISGYGATAWTSTNSNCPSYCTGPSAYDSDGGAGQSSASSVEDTYNFARSYVSLSGSTYLPILRVEAESDPMSNAVANAMGVQGYTYSGVDATTITLDFNLHGSVGVADTNASNRNVLEAGVAVFIGSELEFLGGYGTMVYENILPPVDSQQIFISQGTDVNQFGSINFDINPGDDFFVLGYLSASSRNGFAESWNTLTLEFEDDSYLAAADVSAVPVPAAVWLFGSGLLGLIGIARRNPA